MISTSTTSTTAFCDPEDFVIDGGYMLLSEGATQRSIPILDDSSNIPDLGSGWRVEFKGDNLVWKTHAICFDNPPAHIPSTSIFFILL